MITNVQFDRGSYTAGQTITMTVDAKYPIAITVYCFVTQPPPPEFVPCPDSGSHRMQKKAPFSFRTQTDVFRRDGYLDFTIIDAESDKKSFRIGITARPLLN